MSGTGDLPAVLGRAGLDFHGWHEPDVPYIPPGLAAMAIHFPDVEGRSWSCVNLTDPDILEKANAGWHRVALDGGLFDFDKGRPRFLLAVRPEPSSPEAPEHPEARWAVVGLADPWDLMGAGGETGLLGPDRCRPGFVMLSLDGDVIVCGETWQTEIGTVRVRTPRRHRRFLELAQGIAGGVSYQAGAELRGAAAAWLRSLD
ncbi:hypothetical protein E1264_32205 [Actinomadura sp. KC216]|uniref:hypothetical protein n=1 Tax=Actinomadura sp. KC216 TaxID=2530370 RepID=UPI0010460B81|nr:hypothetical protein [Actinomadura sp. KC216]TDB81792.1 hypothetical protein E1264_32205 [Actinomadura sp. KC216]